MSEVMTLEGGKTSYAAGRYQNGDAPEGRKVRYLAKNGYEGDRKYAEKFFDKGDVLTVKEIYVDRSFSEVEFEEHPDKFFNTVLFEDID